MIINCTKCSGPIIKDLMINSTAPVEISVSFKAKCPHCQNLVTFQLKTEVIRSVTLNGRAVEHTGEGANIRTL